MLAINVFININKKQLCSICWRLMTKLIVAVLADDQHIGSLLLIRFIIARKSLDYTHGDLSDVMTEKPQM